MRMLILLTVLGITGCATNGVTIPPCQPTPGIGDASRAVAMPCVGYSNGKMLSTVPSGLAEHNQPFWPAVIYVDNEGKVRSMRVNP